MKSEGLRQLLGKTITGVVASETSGAPGTQLFLIFNDGTYFEFYSGANESFTCTSGTSFGGVLKVKDYISRFPGATIRSEFILPAPSNRGKQ
jgi:hypothetical protein